jgi:NAD(P)-dependent dehydrogenase (short-subunit alcohol dehydrogenase family)
LTQAEIVSEGGQALFIETDVCKEASVKALVERTVEKWGKVDVLVNNAGIERYARADEYSIGDFDAIVDTNLRGMFLCAKYAFPYLRKNVGCIVNISSVQGVANEPNISVYAAAKAGILGLTRGLSIDFAPAGVRVNSVLPGATANTGMMENALASLEDVPGTIAAISKSIPLGRMGEPMDIAGAVYFLASKEASYITGASLTVDGGLLARLAI